MRLTTHELGHRFGTSPWLFRGLNLDVSPGAITAIIGPSGTGKSTLLAILSGELRPTSGSVDRVGLTRIQTSDQVAHGSPRRTTLDHAVWPLLYAGIRRAEAERLAGDTLRDFGLGGQIAQEFASLSGGEAQRLMLAQATLGRPDLLLADEPTAALDAASATGVIEVLGRLRATGRIVLVATHDPRVVEFCDAVVDLGTQAMREDPS